MEKELVVIEIPNLAEIIILDKRPDLPFTHFDKDRFHVTQVMIDGEEIEYCKTNTLSMAFESMAKELKAHGL
jgi:hypothetical protein